LCLILNLIFRLLFLYFDCYLILCICLLFLLVIITICFILLLIWRFDINLLKLIQMRINFHFTLLNFDRMNLPFLILIDFELVLQVMMIIFWAAYAKHRVVLVILMIFNEALLGLLAQFFQMFQGFELFFVFLLTTVFLDSIYFSTYKTLNLFFLISC